MRTRPVAILVVIQVVLAMALVIVAWTAQTGRASLRADLNKARAEAAAANARAGAAESRAAAAETRASDLQRQVLALTAACCRPGVDPRTVITVTPSAAVSPVPRGAPSASRKPSPPAKPSPHPSPKPSPSPTCRVYNPTSGRCIT